MGHRQHVTRGEAERSEGVTRAAHDRRSGQRSERGVDPATVHRRSCVPSPAPSCGVGTRRALSGAVGVLRSRRTSDHGGPLGPRPGRRACAASRYRAFELISVVLYSMRGARNPFRETSTRTYPHAHAVPGTEPRADARAAASAAWGLPRPTPRSHTHDNGNCHMSWPHAHVLASGLLVASGHARAPRLVVAPLAGGPMKGLCPASIMRAVTLGARPRRREVRARMMA